MRKRKTYYRVFSLKDGTILMSLQSRKPSKSSLPRPRIDEDGVYRESPQQLEDFRHLEDWLKGSYHTTIATRLNTRRSIRELLLPRIDAMEKQLTLNVLLSFAQFEREVISERVKDKMTAARKRGKWVGGRPPLGYDVDIKGKRLVVNKAEARLVCQIFDLYLERQTILEVVKELNRRGITTKRLTSRKGNVTGGQSFQVTNLQQLLANPFYIGKIPVNGELFQGEHEAILPEEVFREVEQLRKGNLRRHAGPNQKGPKSLLRGLLRCRACGCSMTLSYTERNGKRYRYYICTRAQKQGYSICPDPAVNAQAMEEAAIGCLRKVVADSKVPSREKIQAFFDRSWEVLFPAERIRIFRSVLERVDYDGRTEALSLVLSEKGLQGLVRELDPDLVEVA